VRVGIHESLLYFQSTPEGPFSLSNLPSTHDTRPSNPYPHPGLDNLAISNHKSSIKEYLAARSVSEWESPIGSSRTAQCKDECGCWNVWDSSSSRAGY
jgi:hypothetical protein